MGSWDLEALFPLVLHHSLPIPVSLLFQDSRRMLVAWLGFERGLHVIKNDFFFLGRSAPYPFLCILLVDLVEGCKSLCQGESQSPPSLGNSLVQQPARELSWEQSEDKGGVKIPQRRG